jgi:hypothetical protein
MTKNIPQIRDNGRPGDKSSINKIQRLEGSPVPTVKNLPARFKYFLFIILEQDPETATKLPNNIDTCASL